MEKRPLGEKKTDTQRDPERNKEEGNDAGLLLFLSFVRLSICPLFTLCYAKFVECSCFFVFFFVCYGQSAMYIAIPIDLVKRPGAGCCQKPPRYVLDCQF